MKAYLFRDRTWHGGLPIHQCVMRDVRGRTKLQREDDLSQPAACWVLKQDIHDWLVERAPDYRLIYKTKMHEVVIDDRTVSVAHYDVWVEITDPTVAILFKLTWGGA